MSKKKALINETHNRTYKILHMKKIHDYCFICQKRAGSFYASCDPAKKLGFHGNHKPIYSTDYRNYKSWKHNRKTQWKCV